MLGLALVTMFLPATVLTLNCSGKIDLVVAVPASLGSVSEEEWSHVEPFLASLVTYFDDIRLGLVLYGPRPMAVASLEPWVQGAGLSARISLLAQRDLYTVDLGYTDTVHSPSPANTPEAISAMKTLFAARRRPEAKQVGVVMTFSTEDATSPSYFIARDAIVNAAQVAKADNIVLFAVGVRGGVPGFQDIADNFCRLFSLGNYYYISSLTPYLGSAICYEFDPTVSPTTSNCFPELRQPQSPKSPYTDVKSCGTEPMTDPYNCAYFYTCQETSPGTAAQLHRTRCASGTLFDSNLHRCNHKEFTQCYTGLSCPRPQGIFPHPGDCTQFLNCHGSVPAPQSCPEGLRFNPAGFCDFPSNVVCS